MKIKVYATLRNIVGGPVVQLDDVSEATVGQVVDELFDRYPDIRKELLTRNGEFHSAFHFLINGRDAYYKNGMDTVITDQDDIRIFPPVGGGH